MASWRDRRRDSDGAVAVEFALLLPFILAVFAGLFDFGMLLNAQIQVSQAAQAGARALALGLDESVVTARAEGASPALEGAVSVYPSGCSGVADPTASVIVSTPFHFPIPIPEVDDIVIRQKAEMPCAPD